MPSPEAISISNVSALCDAGGKPDLKCIVQGAKLFIAHQARLLIEKRKVVFLKVHREQGRRH